jgi:hypothetical protein
MLFSRLRLEKEPQRGSNSAVYRFQVSGFRKQYEVIANCADFEGIGENIGANDSRRKAAQAAIAKIGFI